MILKPGGGGGGGGGGGVGGGVDTLSEKYFFSKSLDFFI